MTFLGKLLVITQVVFSIVFMAFAGAVFQREQTWKTKSDKFEKDYKDKNSQLQEEIAAHDADNLKNKDDVQKATEELNSAKADLKNRSDDLADEKKLRETITIEKTNAQAQAETAEQVARVRTEETEKQLAINRKLLAQAEDHIATIAQVRKENYDHARRDKERQAKHDKTLKELAELKVIVKKSKADTSPEVLAQKQLPPPAVEGKVHETRTDSANGIQFVEITLGSDDGLAVGHTLFVSRGAKYLGQIKLVSVDPDTAVGTVVKAAKNGIIEEGDYVTTKL